MRKHLKYLSYVLRHKWFVLLAGTKVGAPLWRLIIHDWSKFLPSEWFPYVTYFYGTVTEEERRQCIMVCGHCPYPTKQEAKKAFGYAWNHHQKRNKHHAQYWVLLEDSGAVVCLEIPRGYLLEMVADWMGAGRAINGRWEVGEWYLESVDKIQLHPKTRFSVETLLINRGHILNYSNTIRTQFPKGDLDDETASYYPTD